MQAIEALHVLLKEINSSEYRDSLKKFECIKADAMQQIKQTCPEISAAENRLKKEGMKLFREKVLSARPNDNDIVYRFYLLSYNIWLMDAELCTGLDLSDDPSQNTWELKDNLSGNICEFLDFVEFFEKKYERKIIITDRR